MGMAAAAARTLGETIARAFLTLDTLRGWHGMVLGSRTFPVRDLAEAFDGIEIQLDLGQDPRKVLKASCTQTEEIDVPD